MFSHYENTGSHNVIAYCSSGKQLAIRGDGLYWHWEKIIIEFKNEPKARTLEHLSISRCKIYYGEEYLNGAIAMLERYQNHQSYDGYPLIEEVKLTPQDFDCAKRRIKEYFSSL